MKPVYALLTATALMAVPTLALANDWPPANALPLSEIIATVEKNHNAARFQEVEWDDDGYWEMTFRNTDGRRQRLRIDPFTGEPWSRR